MLSQLYATEGRDYKKISTNAIVLDLELFCTMTDPTFIARMQESLNKFATLLKSKKEGKKSLTHTHT